MLMPYPIFKAVPMERGRIMEPFTNLPHATHVIFEFRTVAVVARVRPHVSAFHESFFAFLAAGIEVDDHCSIIYSEHDIGGINIVMDDAEFMEMMNAFFNLLKTNLCIERSSVMIDALDEILVVLGEAQTLNAASSDNAAVIGSDVRMWMIDKKLTDSSFSKQNFAQTGWCS